MKHFAILSQGCYSDYSPVYYIGDYPLTSEEFKKKGRELGDLVIFQFESLPERVHKCDSDWCWHSSSEPKTGRTEKYDPRTNERVYSVDDEKWNTMMEEWLFSLGFEKLPEDIPEININYSDVPHN